MFSKKVPGLFVFSSLGYRCYDDVFAKFVPGLFVSSSLGYRRYDAVFVKFVPGLFVSSSYIHIFCLVNTGIQV